MFANGQSFTAGDVDDPVVATFPLIIRMRCPTQQAR